MARSLFEQIVCVDETGLTGWGMEELQSLSTAGIIQYPDIPSSDTEVIARTNNADCVLVSWNTPITGDAMRASPRLKYVGMCCTLYDENSSNVDIAAATELGTSVRGVRDYGDERVVEFIFAELIHLISMHVPRNSRVLDADGVGQYRHEFLAYPTIIVSDKVAGWTAQARHRLTKKVLDNITAYLSSDRGASRD